MASNMVKPCIKVVGLHVEGLRALRKVDWPEDGLDWQDRVPDMVLVGGVNGSGKTTLLELIASAARMIPRGAPLLLPPDVRKTWADYGTVNASIDFRIATKETNETTFRVAIGDVSFVEARETKECLLLTRGSLSEVPELHFRAGFAGDRLRSALESERASEVPGIIYLPTDRRFETPATSFKAAGQLGRPSEFFYRFQAATEWKESFEAALYGARWADLNAKEEGRPDEATHFDAYAKAFRAFFGGTKSLVWERGELFVRIEDTGALHTLSGLSSGEMQVLILAGELLRRWRPGSLVLIDEPELHFHSSWQTTLWSMLEKWQQERGGQVIATTQSTHLFRIAEPGTTVLLGSGLP